MSKYQFDLKRQTLKSRNRATDLASEWDSDMFYQSRNLITILVKVCSTSSVIISLYSSNVLIKFASVRSKPTSSENDHFTSADCDRV